MIPTLQLGQFGRAGGSAAPLPLSDHYFSSVRLLAHMDGANGSTTFTDSSPLAATLTANGAAQISTAQSQFGGASGLFAAATSDYVLTPNSADYGIGAGDFTVEGWLRQAAQGSATRCMFDNRSGGEGIGIYSSVASAGQEDRLCVYGAALLAGSGSTGWAANTWQHWAVCRSGTTLRGFIGGAQVWSVTDARTYAGTTRCYLGANTLVTQPLNGNQDDVRLTIGVARYTAPFAVPTAAFPNS